MRHLSRWLKWIDQRSRPSLRNCKVVSSIAILCQQPEGQTQPTQVLPLVAVKEGRQYLQRIESRRIRIHLIRIQMDDRRWQLALILEQRSSASSILQGPQARQTGGEDIGFQRDHGGIQSRVSGIHFKLHILFDHFTPQTLLVSSYSKASARRRMVEVKKGSPWRCLALSLRNHTCLMRFGIFSLSCSLYTSIRSALCLTYVFDASWLSTIIVLYRSARGISHWRRFGALERLEGFVL